MMGLFEDRAARSHAAVWLAIERIAAENGFSSSGFAKELGLDATCFNKSKRAKDGRLRWPNVGTVALILAYTGTSFADWGRMVDEAAA